MWDRMRSEDIRIGCVLKYMLRERVDQSVMRWHRHIERMSEEGIVKRINRAGVDGKRGRDRPRTRWHDGVREVLGERGMTIQQAERCLQDRKK